MCFRMFKVFDSSTHSASHCSSFFLGFLRHSSMQMLPSPSPVTMIMSFFFLFFFFWNVFHIKLVSTLQDMAPF